ncbi:hypothetical protein [Rufibacter soli]
MSQYAVFTTKEGEVVYRPQSRWASYSWKAAIRKAKSLGLTSLIAIEADGREVDYSLMLTKSQGAT